MQNDSTYRRLVAGLMLVVFCMIGIIDLHQWGHIDDVADDTSCELCILSHQQDSQLILPAPTSTLVVVKLVPELTSDFEPYTPVTGRLYHLGFPNRPPPALT